MIVTGTIDGVLNELDVTYFSILDPELEQTCLFVTFFLEKYLEVCVLADVVVIIFSDTAGLDWTLDKLDILVYLSSVNDPGVECCFDLRFPTGSLVSCTLLRISNIVLVEIEFASAFCEFKEQEDDVFESLTWVHESVDSEAGQLTTMHALEGQAAGFASNFGARLCDLFFCSDLGVAQYTVRSSVSNWHKGLPW